MQGDVVDEQETVGYAFGLQLADITFGGSNVALIDKPLESIFLDLESAYNFVNDRAENSYRWCPAAFWVSLVTSRCFQSFCYEWQAAFQSLTSQVPAV